jgi:hypothetical protein
MLQGIFSERRMGGASLRLLSLLSGWVADVCLRFEELRLRLWLKALQKLFIIKCIVGRFL